MANYAQATILSLDNVLKPLNITDTIEFDIPYFNNVRILSTEFVGSKLKSPMFGDEMDFRLWKKLKLTFGFRNGNYTIYTLESGWKYVYVSHRATFDIYDDTGLKVFINPEILEAKGSQIGEEGCLSLPGKSEEVERPNYVKVKALNEKGEEFILEAEELLARAVCHENDHLDGILYIDHVK